MVVDYPLCPLKLAMESLSTPADFNCRCDLWKRNPFAFFLPNKRLAGVDAFTYWASQRKSDKPFRRPVLILVPGTDPAIRAGYWLLEDNGCRRRGFFKD